MNDFTYCAPTKVFFGRGAADNVGPAISAFAPKKVLIHYGGGSVVRSGLLDKIKSSLDKSGISYIELGGVEPNPKVGFVRKAKELCVSEGVDFILAVGGGSVIDSAKCTSFSVANNADPWDIITGVKPAVKRLPVAVVLTISAAGSEMSDSEVITNPDINIKKGLSNELSRPVMAFMDPELTYTVSKYQTGCGIVDIMMHTMERYYTTDDPESTVLTDRIAESILLSVKEAGAVAINDPENYEARATLMWASSLSHNSLTGCGKDVKALVVHGLEHGLSGVFDNVAHGAGLAVLYPAWAKYIYKYCVPRFARLAVTVWGVEPGGSAEDIALRGIDAMKEYFHSIGMPTSLSELGVGSESFYTIANNITNNGSRSLPSYIPLARKEVMDILNLAK